MPVGTLYFHHVAKYIGKPGFPRNIFLEKVELKQSKM